MTLQGFLIAVLTLVHVVVALFVILLVLMQKSSEQGVGAAFGGGMTETVFGAGTTTALVRMTIWCACLLLATTLILAVLHSHRGRPRGSLIQRTLSTTPTAPESAPPLGTQPSPLPVTPAPAAGPGAAPAQNQSSPAPAAPAKKTP